MFCRAIEEVKKMADHDSPISLNPAAGGTLAKQLVQGETGHWPVPEGTVLASALSRALAYMLDTMFVMGILLIVTSILGGAGGNILRAYDLELLRSGGKGTALFIVDWFLILGGNFLYHKHTGLRMSRSLGQSWFGLAVVREDGKQLDSSDWDRRARRKLVYVLPLVGPLYFGVRDLLRIRRRHTHQSSIDLAVASIVAKEDSLPPASRRHIR
jgi:uncharacterized RDD family membrane protein YckC